VSNQISLHPASIARSLGLVTLLLALISLGATAFRTWAEHSYHPMLLFDLNSEYNIPTFFSACLLLFAALILAVITSLEKNRATGEALYWQILSWGFFLMAIDEVLSCHERLVVPIRKLLRHGNLGIFYFAWVIPAIVLVIFLVLFFRGFLLRLPTKTRRNLLFAATIYLGGAIGFELIGGCYAEMYGEKNLLYTVISNIEESLEMIGVIILIWGLLTHIGDKFNNVQFQIDTRA
jgi:hypothetical protein